MKIRVYSDIHNEFRAGNRDEFGSSLYAFHFQIPELEDDKETVLVLAGDVDCNMDSLNHFLISLSRRFKAVIYTPGNHEYYRQSIKWTNERLKAMESEIPNLYVFLEDSDPVVFDGVGFVGGTLWTDLQNGNPLVELAVSRGMADYGLIYKTGRPENEINFDIACGNNLTELNQLRRPSNRWDVDSQKRLHKKYKKNIQRQIDSIKGEVHRIVMVTHHVPDYVEYPMNKFPLTNMSWGWYCSDMEGILSQVDVAIHGHIHEADCILHNGVVYICNAVGYYGHENTNYSNNGVFFV